MGELKWRGLMAPSHCSIINVYEESSAPRKMATQIASRSFLKWIKI
jgi:hypothetical protein